MSEVTPPNLRIAISSSALFDLSAADQVFREEGLAAYGEHQRAREKETLSPGPAFPLARKLLNLNAQEGIGVEVVLLSRNSADTGLRVFNSIQAHELPIIRAAFTGGGAPYRYMPPFQCQLFLSTNPIDVTDALDHGVAAATVLVSRKPSNPDGPVKFAFDGDAVLFSDEAEQVYQREGLAVFAETEQKAADQPLTPGPFKPFLDQLNAIQSRFGEAACPIRTALVTARSSPSHERVIKTLRSWGVRVDESLFLGGRDKTQFLRAYGADIFFDDQAEHCHLASREVVAGHVNHGVMN
jgi:5'-nucleotidase